MDLDPDRALIRDLASDDSAVRRKALGDLYERHQARVFNTAYRVLGSAADAQDVTQEVFLHVADRIRSFRGDASLTSWVYRVTVNLAIDARRRAARRPALRTAPGEDGQDLEKAERRPGVADPAADPVALAEQGEAERKVHQALDRLSPKLRAVVVLRYFENLSYEDLADVLQTSIGTVKSRLNRAHAALEGLLGPAARPGAG